MTSGRVVVLEQFAHLDWDWVKTFEEYFRECVMPVYRGVNDAAAAVPFPYSVCEMGFLRRFEEKYPNDFITFAKNPNLTVVGGGITSPDNLLTSGEAFIRTYLVGLHWLPAPLEWSRTVWLPDDFGHDSQLPVVLVAMGAAAVGFSRVPGDTQTWGNSADSDPGLPGQILNTDPTGNGGIDFHWRAADGSTIFAHWMPRMYWQGGGISGEDSIGEYLRENETGSPSRYVHVPVGADFQPPNPEVPKYVSDWNGSSTDDKADVRSFAWYVERVMEEVDAGRATLKTRTFHGDGDPDHLQATSFLSNPYFIGFYASRMQLKTLHYETTRLLVQAEVLDAACAAGGGPVSGDVAERLLGAWNDLAPSTHHDYITGTATDPVYEQEQLTLSTRVCADATQLRSSLATTIQANVRGTAGSVLAFNTLGFARSGVVRMDDGSSTWADVPAMGWSVTSTPLPPSRVTVRTFDDGSVQVWNDRISFTVSPDQNWGISHFWKADDGISILSGTANTFRFWQDAGNIYTFGYECASPEETFREVDASFAPDERATVTQDPLNLQASVSARVVASPAGADGSYPYDLTYTLCAGDPFVTISIAGAAPEGMSVFVDFPLKGGPVDRMEHGTPYHWDYKPPRTFGNHEYRAVFEPTHDFVSVWNGETPLAAIYHGGVPAWAVEGSTLTGCILRNTPGDTSGQCHDWGANGSDADRHTIIFALRIGDGLQHADTGAPLREARAFSNPLFGTTTVDSDGPLPTCYSLASTGDNALLTVAKRGTADPDDLYLRVYTPSNAAEPVELTVAAPFSQVTGATALERPLVDETALDIETAPGRIRFTAINAVNTLHLK